MAVLAPGKFPYGMAPEFFALLPFEELWIPITADPLIRVTRRFFASVGRQRVGLAVDQVGVAADDITRRVQYRFLAPGSRAEFNPVFDQARLEVDREAVRSVLARRLALFRVLLSIRKYSQKYFVRLLLQQPFAVQADVARGGQPELQNNQAAAIPQTGVI